MHLIMYLIKCIGKHAGSTLKSYITKFAMVKQNMAAQTHILRET